MGFLLANIRNNRGLTSMGARNFDLFNSDKFNFASLGHLIANDLLLNIGYQVFNRATLYQHNL